MSAIELPTIPAALAWEVAPQAWHIDADAVLHVTAGGETDYFIDPQDGSAKQNAPRLMFTPDARFTLSARIDVGFEATYDAGALLIYAHPTCWAKICFEFSPQQQPMIVSVVTNTRSDDCNAAVLTSNTTYLRITKLGDAFAFHYSLDGSQWPLVRYFTLAQSHDVRIGFVAQAPTGTACTVRFSEITYAPRPVQNIRSGE